MGTQPPDSKREMGRLMALSQVGFEMVMPIVLGLWLDSQFGWTPWGVSVGAVLGLVGGLAHLLHLLKRFEDAARAEQGADAPRSPEEHDAPRSP